MNNYPDGDTVLNLAPTPPNLWGGPWYGSQVDMVVSATSIAVLFIYHLLLAVVTVKFPSRTTLGLYGRHRRSWVHGIMKDNDKKNIIAVQSLRNTVMESSLMATTYTLIICGLGAFLASTEHLKQNQNHDHNSTRNVENFLHRGSNSSSILLLKATLIIVLFLFAFFCAMWSIVCLNQVMLFINVPPPDEISMNEAFVAQLMCKACAFQFVSHRISYVAFTLLIWVFWALPMLPVSCFIVSVLYSLDFMPSNASKAKSPVAPEPIKIANEGSAKLPPVLKAMEDHSHASSSRAGDFSKDLFSSYSNDSRYYWQVFGNSQYESRVVTEH